MFGLSGEHILVLLVILLIFGPKRLPDLGHSVGRTLKNFKDAMNGNEAKKPNEQIEHQQAANKTEQPAAPRHEEHESVKS